MQVHVHVHVQSLCLYPDDLKVYWIGFYFQFDSDKLHLSQEIAANQSYYVLLIEYVWLQK